jgi:hypothetical protein
MVGEAFSLNRARAAALVGTFAAITLLAGCGGGAYYQAGVAYGPPAPVVEGPYGVAPGPDYIWTPGFYDWYGGTCCGGMVSGGAGRIQKTDGLLLAGNATGTITAITRAAGNTERTGISITSWQALM